MRDGLAILLPPFYMNWAHNMVPGMLPFPY
jgi:hypothetical protein